MCYGGFDSSGNYFHLPKPRTTFFGSRKSAELERN